MPKKIAMEMIMTGEPVSGGRAFELGLVNRVVPRDKVVAAALEPAEAISVNAPLSVKASKRIASGIIDGQVSAEDQGWAQSEAESRAVMNSSDAKEGPLAFAEKRAPVWQGRRTRHRTAKVQSDEQISAAVRCGLD